VGDVFNLVDQLRKQEHAGKSYAEFIQRPDMSVGIYRLAPGEPDLQQPHTEDEIYYVLSGEGMIVMDGAKTPVHPGSLVFVPKGQEHRFTDYPTGLTLLVVFAPAYGSTAHRTE